MKGKTVTVITNANLFESEEKNEGVVSRTERIHGMTKRIDVCWFERHNAEVKPPINARW